MSHKIKIYIISMGLFLLGGMQLSIISPSVAAQGGLPCTPNCNLSPPPPPPPTPGVNSSPECQNTDSAPKLNNCLSHSKVVSDLQTIVNVLAAGVGIVVVAMIILGGIQYSMAGDNATAVTAAKQRITNALIALVAFIFMFAFVNWLIPGGVFG